MSEKWPTPEERFAAVQQAVTPHGFTAQYRGASDGILRRFMPLKEFSPPEAFEAAVLGQIEGRDVAVAEYATSSTDDEGNVSWTRSHLAVVLDPNFVGTASIINDWKFGTGGAILNAALWIPPFTIVKAIQLIFDSKNPDHELGDRDFDKRYKVHAESAELAANVFHPAFRAAILQMQFQGAIELRHGAMLFNVRGAKFDAEGVMKTLGHVPLLLHAALNRTATGYR
jgi:hypothetical protein